MLLQSHSQHGIRFVLMKMVAIFIAHGSIDLNVQCLKEIIDRKWTEKKVLGRHRKVLVHSESADTEKENSIRKQVSS